MKTIRLLSAALIGLCVQPLMVSASAQQSAQLGIDSVSKQLRSHPKTKKSSPAPLASAKTAPGTKAKREVPAIMKPVGQSSATQTAQPVVKKTTAVVAADSVPAVRRSPNASKTKPPR